MALSNSLKESMAIVLKEQHHFDPKHINTLIESIEKSFYSKKGNASSPSVKSNVEPVVPEAVIESTATSMKRILLSNDNGSTGLSVPQPEQVISKTKSAMSSMARICG